MAALSAELGLAPSPDFEACVAAAGNEAVAARRSVELLVSAARLANKALAGHVEGTQKKATFLGGKKPQHDDPVAEAYLADALSDATASGHCDLEPLAAVLRELAPIRQAFGDKVHSALVAPLE